MQIDVNMLTHTKMEPTLTTTTSTTPSPSGSTLEEEEQRKPLQQQQQEQQQQIEPELLCEPSTEPSNGLDFEERMKLALNGVMYKGETPTCAARKWKLERTTILVRLLREKKRLRQAADGGAGNGHDGSPNGPRKLFQSKFTSNQLLSAQQEEELANYLKQCYEMQWQRTATENGSNDDNPENHAPAPAPKGTQGPKDTSKPPPLLCEEVARSFTHNFVHMHKLRYPSSWDAKQQAATDWFNGFVDRNPEVIEYVAPTTRERKRRKRTSRTKMIKLEANGHGHGHGEDETELGLVEAGAKRRCGLLLLGANMRHSHESEEEESRDDDNNGENVDEWAPEISIGADSLIQTQIRIKDEPKDDVPEDDFDGHLADLSNTNNGTEAEDADPMIPEVVYQTPTSNKSGCKEPAEELLPTASIAESVKRRTMRKPRILAEHLYAAEMTMEPDNRPYPKHRNHSFAVRKLSTVTLPPKISKMQNFYQQQTQHSIRNKVDLDYGSDQNDTNDDPTPTPSCQYSHARSLDDLKDSIEKMHTDMNYLMQSMLMEMSENNRLLRRLISSQESKH